MEILRRLGQWEIYTLRSMQEDLEPGASEVLATTDEEQTTKSAYLFYSMSGRLNEALAAFDAISNCVSEAEYVRISEKIRYLAYAESTAVLKEAGAMLGTSADPAHASRPARELLADIEEVLAELPSVDTRQSFRRWLSILLQQMAEFLTLMDLG